MEIPNINKRIRQIIDYYANGVVKKFAENIEMQQQTLNRLFVIDKRTGKYPIATTDILQKISEMYDCVDVNWLLTGQGKMLRNNQKIENITGNANNNLNIGRDNNAGINITSQHVEDFIRITEKNQEQTDRMLSIIEKMVNK